MEKEIKDDRIPDIDRIAEERYQMVQSEQDEAKELGMTVKELREEKWSHQLHKDETEMYDQLATGIY